MRKINIILFIIIVLSFVFGCKKKTSPKDSSTNTQDTTSTPKDTSGYGAYNPTPYNLSIPAGFPIMNIPDDNPMTVEGVALGRKLYYDVKLSEGGPVQGHACATCHQQDKSFSSPIIFHGASVMHHVNLGWVRKFLWKGEPVNTLEEAMMFEARDFFQADLNLLSQDTSYKRMFYKAFGSDEITYERIAKALAQFFRTQISGNSKFDKYNRGEATLTKEELDGMIIFFSERGDCFHCHGSPLFSDYEVHNIGLDSTFTENNKGHFLVTGDSSDWGKFRTPSLRNVELTAPYMHDGRFKTLEEVVNFYSEGVHENPNLDPIMYHSRGIPHLNLTDYEKRALVAFLKTLTDTSYINNPELGPPQ